MTDDDHVGIDLDDLYDASPVGWVTTSRDWTILKVNATLLEWLGREAEEVVGTHFSLLLTPAGRIYHETHHAPLVLHRGRASEVAAELAAASRRIPVLLESRAGSQDREVPLIHTSVVRVEERRRYERELLAARRVAEASEARMRLVHDATAKLVGAVSVDEVADVLVQTIDGLPGMGHTTVWLVDASGEGMREIGSARVRTRRLPIDAEHPTARALRDRELVVDRRTGMVALPLGHGDGAVAAVCEDLDEFPEGHVEVLRTLSRLAGAALERGRLHQRKDEILQAAARDLRAPLATVMGHGATLQGLLEERLERSELHALDRMVDTAERMHLLVDGFLELARIEAGSSHPERRRVVLADVVADAVADLAAAAETEGVTVDVTDHSTGHVVQLDPALIRQAIGHLVMEAVLRSPRSAHVQVTVDANPDVATVTLRDAGSGRSSDRDEWVQATSTEPESSTLGLAIARGFIGAHGGTVQVEQTLAGGWTLVQLPLDGRVRPRPAPQA